MGSQEAKTGKSSLKASSFIHYYLKIIMKIWKKFRDLTKENNSPRKNNNNSNFLLLKITLHSTNIPHWQPELIVAGNRFCKHVTDHSHFLCIIYIGTLKVSNSHEKDTNSDHRDDR